MEKQTNERKKQNKKKTKCQTKSVTSFKSFGHLLNTKSRAKMR